MIFQFDKVNIFLSGAFQETGEDLTIIQNLLSSIGLSVIIKDAYNSVDSEELIRDCGYFFSIVGIEEPVIKTPSGESLPQLELNYAIRHQKPVVCFLKRPIEQGITDKQEFFRSSMKLRMGESIQPYDHSDQLSGIIERLIQSGIEPASQVLRPNKVFISHSSKDKPAVERMVKRLMQCGINPFYDKHDINVGDNLKKTIQRAISEVGYVIICLSDNAFESEWVRKEIEWAIESDRHLAIDDMPFILPVKVGEFTIPESFETLKGIRFVNLCADFDSAVNELVAAMMP